MSDSDRDLEITKGWKYLVRIAEEKDAIGTFRGYSMVGSESAVVIEMENKRLRFIPVEQISYMELLENSLKEEPKTSKKGMDTYYG
ncbi:MAG: hypothetical protein WCR24_01190 [Candidatus Methanomethylophilaceae archaeon]